MALLQSANASRFMPHGMCYLWEPELLWLHVIADMLTGLAYWAIPPTLLVLVLRARREVPEGAEYMKRGLPHEWMFVAFSLFIVACGTTHFFSAWNVWNADYWASGVIKALTATVSIATAIALPPLVPRALALVRSARESELHRSRLEQANEELRVLRDALQQELSSASTNINSLAEEVAARRRQMEQALEEANAAREEAASANDAKTDFLAVMSHELRTPLNAIIGYTELLDMGAAGPVSQGQRGQLERIRVSAKHLVSVIDDILMFARRRPTTHMNAKMPVRLRPLLAEICDMVRPAVDRKGIELACEIEDVTFLGDWEELSRPITNLLSNAVKFTDDGRVHVTASIDDGMLRIVVDDDGPGIAEADRERIFEPFWQVDRSYTRRAGGTGLGLTIARATARRLGGDITIEDAPGGGSRFTVSVPAELAQDDSTES